MQQRENSDMSPAGRERESSANVACERSHGDYRRRIAGARTLKCGVRAEQGLVVKIDVVVVHVDALAATGGPYMRAMDLGRC